MAKSTGNFMNLEDAMEKYGADATRFALADAGDGLEDANFLDKTADDAILKLYTEREFIEEALKETTRVGEYSWNDRVFDTEINNLITLCQQSYEKMQYREVLKIGFYDLQNARNDYRKATTGQGLSHILPDEKFEGMHLDLVKKFARIQALLLLPITPHWSEHIWKDLLHEKDTVMNARFPVAEKIDDSLIAAATYIRALGSKIRSAEDTANKKKSKKGKVVQGLNDPKILTLNIASHFPQWQEEVIEIVKQSYHESQNIFNGKETENLKNAGLLKDKRIMPFVAMLKKQVIENGKIAFIRKLSFDERLVLETNLEFLRRDLANLRVEEIVVKSDGNDDGAVPGVPTYSVDLK